MNYKVRSAKGWWKENAMGYTQDENEAGIFAADALVWHNLDLCTLYLVR